MVQLNNLSLGVKQQSLTHSKEDENIWDTSNTNYQLMHCFHQPIHNGDSKMSSFVSQNLNQGMLYKNRSCLKFLSSDYKELLNIHSYKPQVHQSYKPQVHQSAFSDLLFNQQYRVAQRVSLLEVQECRNSPRVLDGLRVVQSLYFTVYGSVEHCLSFYYFSFDHCIVF